MHRFTAILLILFAASLSAQGAVAADSLLVFCGAVLKKPMDDITQLYQQKTGIRVNAVYGGVGTLFSQILLSRQGDVFVVPSPDIMERAKEKNVIVRGSTRNIAYVVPCINTQKGNPRNIRGLKDLARPGIKVGLANPEIVYTGAIAMEIIENDLAADEKKALKENIVTYTEDFNKLASLIVLKQVDAIIGLHFLEGWYPDKVETVKLKPGEVQRIGSVQAGVITYTSKKDAAGKFINFLAADEVQAIFRRYHYFSTADDAFVWVGAKKPIGGEFAVPTGWGKK